MELATTERMAYRTTALSDSVSPSSGRMDWRSRTREEAMARISNEQRTRLTAAIHDHDFLHRIVRKIEQQLRVVFHAHEIEVSFVRAAAEEILMADIFT